MNSEPSQCKEAVRQLIIDAGAVAAGFANVEPVPENQQDIYKHWVNSGHHAGMEYMERYQEVRDNPEELLPGAKTIIVSAFPYVNKQSLRHPLFADYALGKDYHTVLRKALEPVCNHIKTIVANSETRICIDTAPLRERFWASRAGVGYIGLNNQLIVPGAGSAVFIASILWTHSLEPDQSLENKKCLECGKCVKACPTGALNNEGGIDARRCLSYLTIEHRGSFPEDICLNGRIYGCDVCRNACPLDILTDKPILPDFTPDDALMALTADDIENMTQEQFSLIFSKSAVKRAKLEGLKRNVASKGRG